MNTAVARRLAVGDRVMWINKEDSQSSGQGTITRITAHAVEVRWDNESRMRYGRVHLHNFRHANVLGAFPSVMPSAARIIDA